MTKTITWTVEDNERYEEMEMEFIGGPFDGTRLFMPVVREGPSRFRALEMTYEKPPIVEHPHDCRGCGRVVDARKLDEHAKECSNPARLAQYRRNKSAAGKRSAHKRFHEGRGITKPDCPLCVRAMTKKD